MKISEYEAMRDTINAIRRNVAEEVAEMLEAQNLRVAAGAVREKYAIEVLPETCPRPKRRAKSA